MSRSSTHKIMTNDVNEEYKLLRIIKAVTFDAGDTLIHLWVHKTQRFAHLCQQIGIVLPTENANLAATVCERIFQERYKKNKKGSTSPEWWYAHNRAGLQAAGVSGDLDLLARQLYEVMNQLPQTWTLDPDALMTLESLRQSGIPLAVISNWNGTLNQILQELGIRSYFKMIVDSHLIGIRKPNPEIFYRFSRVYEIDPTTCVHIGDSPDTDEQLALSVQAVPVLYDPLGCLPAKGYRISRLGEVIELIKGGFSDNTSSRGT